MSFNCQVCKSEVFPTSNKAVCPSCGSEYRLEDADGQVIRVGTFLKLWLVRPVDGVTISGREIELWGKLFDAYGNPLPDKKLKARYVNPYGQEFPLWEGTTDPAGGYGWYPLIPVTVGVGRYDVWFEGDELYEPCGLSIEIIVIPTPPPEATHTLVMRIWEVFPWFDPGKFAQYTAEIREQLAPGEEYLGYEYGPGMMALWFKSASPIAWAVIAAIIKIVMLFIVIIGGITIVTKYLDLKRWERIEETVSSITEQESKILEALEKDLITREQADAMLAALPEVPFPPAPAIPWELVMGGLIALAGIGVVIAVVRR